MSILKEFRNSIPFLSRKKTSDSELENEAESDNLPKHKNISDLEFLTAKDGTDIMNKLLIEHFKENNPDIAKEFIKQVQFQNKVVSAVTKSSNNI